MTQRRITLTIDRIVTDDPSLNRAALTRALMAEVRSRLANGEAIGVAGARASAMVQADRGADGVSERVARATMQGIGR